MDRYIEKILRDFGMDSAKRAVTPMETSKIEALPDGTSALSKTELGTPEFMA